MPAYKKISPSTGRASWFASFYYTDWTGKKRQKKKEGFDTRKAALEYERGFLEYLAIQPDIAFRVLVEKFMDDYKARRRHTTTVNKQYTIKKHLIPFFGDMPVNEITPATVREWQTMMKETTKSDGEHLAGTTLREAQVTLSSIFNFAVKFHGLKQNPVTVAGAISKAKSPIMNFWTVDQFRRFIAAVPEDDLHRAAFLVLFYTGIRRGELLALTPADFDGETLSITKTYKRLLGQDIIQPPKTEKGNRKIFLPAFLGTLLQDVLARLGHPADNQRIFDSISAFSLRASLLKYAKAADVPAIRVHDLRHSHVALLIHEGFAPLVISERLGHESIQTTLDRYGHLYPSKQSEIAARLEGFAP